MAKLLQGLGLLAEPCCYLGAALALPLVLPQLTSGV